MSTEREQLLLPLAQHPSPNVFLIARSAPGEQPMKMTAALENAVRDLDPDFRPRPSKTPDGVPYVQHRHRRVAPAKQHARLPGAVGRRGRQLAA